MDAAIIERFFLLVAAGVGLFLAGGLNLALGRKGNRVWVRGLATVVICSLVLAGLALATRAELAVRAATILVPILLVGFVVGSEWFTRQAASLLNFCRKPGVRWGLVTAGGVALVVGSGVAFELADEAAMEQTLKDLNLETGRPTTRPAEGAHATTDRGSPVVLKEPIVPRDASDLREPEAKILRDGQKIDHVIRRGGPTDVSNCHGWVFTGGKYLLSPDDVELILRENGYQDVQEPQPGDLVVYRQDGLITHTAVVRYVTEGQPVIVEGKWGAMGVFLHSADHSNYGPEYTFHRSARQGHLLIGVGGSPVPHAAQPAVAE